MEQKRFNILISTLNLNLEADAKQRIINSATLTYDDIFGSQPYEYQYQRQYDIISILNIILNKKTILEKETNINEKKSLFEFFANGSIKEDGNLAKDYNFLFSIVKDLKKNALI